MTATDEQRRVVSAPLEGPHLVDAGAGTGKTFTLVERAASLVESGKLQPENLLVVTFTRAAAAEIAGRLEQRFAATGKTGRPTCGTFHQIAAGLLREFAYDTGTSPDIRAVDDARARGIFAAAFADLTHGKLGVDTSALPLLDRTRELERGLAGIALRLKNTNTSVDDFERDALAAADTIQRLPFGAFVKLTPAKRQPVKGWPRPNPPLSPRQLAEEADRERRNVRAVAALFRRFDELLAAESLLTFGDVLTRATSMLRAYPAIAATVRARWLHAMVDEFQDTNSIQVDFLKALFGDDLRPVLVVGDVRQAIYAFNGAEPEGIVNFRTMAGCERYPLSINRRSYKTILDVAHAALAQAGAVPPELHNELAAHRGEAATVAVRAQLFTGDDALAQEADAVARTAAELVRNGASPKSIAVLMRSRSKAPIFAEALRRRGLVVQLHGGAGFFDAAEIREIVAWLKLVEDPTDEPSLVVALQSAAIALGDGALALLAQDALVTAAFAGPLDVLRPAEAERVDRFRAIARIIAALADVPLVDAVARVVTESGAEVARLAASAGELDQARANLNKFVRLAADFASDRPTARIHDFLTELEERAAIDEDEPEAELEGERVSIMTVHAAKGLEWDHVFVANVSAAAFPLKNAGVRDLVVAIDDRDNGLAFMHSVEGGEPMRWKLAREDIDMTTGEICEKATDDREEHRLFYVALTRARNALYVTGRRRADTHKASPCLASVQAWLSAQHEQPEPTALVSDAPRDVAELLLPLARPVAAEQTAIIRRLEAQLRRESAPPDEPQRHGALSYSAIALHESCPRRARYHYVLGLPDLGDEAPPPQAEGDHREPARRDPARFGRIVHLVLESVAKARIAGEAVDLDVFLDQAMEDEQSSDDVALRNDARKAAEAAIPSLATLTPIAAEQRFDIELDGVALSGYIDLLARNEHGDIVIVDYKTGSTPAEHYAMQFALYRKAVERDYGHVLGTMLLRIGQDGAQLERVTPAPTAALSLAIASARSMSSSTPSPGRHCQSCPYAFRACDAAPTTSR